MKITKLRVVVACIFYCFNSVVLADTILTISPSGAQFQEVLEGIKGDLEGEVEFIDLAMKKTTKVKDIKLSIKNNAPKAIVLVGNASVNLYTKFQKENVDDVFPPSVAVAALFLEKFIPKLKNSTGIRYEIPLVTSAISIRSLLNSKLKKVGVIHRELMSDFIAINREYAKSEGIELVSIEVRNKDKDRPKNLKKEISKLVDSNIDALWIINDNNLLNAKTLSGAWLPVLGKSETPVLVGVEQLLSTKLGLATFAVVPDHYGLGVQTSSLLIDIMDNDWQIDSDEMEQPLSVKKVVNVSILDYKKIKYDKQKLSTFNEIIN